MSCYCHRVSFLPGNSRMVELLTPELQEHQVSLKCFFHIVSVWV